MQSSDDQGTVGDNKLETSNGEASSLGGVGGLQKHDDRCGQSRSKSMLCLLNCLDSSATEKDACVENSEGDWQREDVGEISEAGEWLEGKWDDCGETLSKEYFPNIVGEAGAKVSRFGVRPMLIEPRR